MPPNAQSEPVTIVSHRSRSNATLAASFVAAANPVDDLDAAHGADAARRALAARLDGAELHGEPRLLAHVDGVVEHDEAAVAEHRADRGELLVVERRIELRLGDVSAERTAGLDGADRSAGGAAAAEVVEDLAQRACRRRSR